MTEGRGPSTCWAHTVWELRCTARATRWGGRTPLASCGKGTLPCPKCVMRMFFCFSALCLCLPWFLGFVCGYDGVHALVDDLQEGMLLLWRQLWRLTIFRGDCWLHLETLPLLLLLAGTLPHTDPEGSHSETCGHILEYYSYAEVRKI